MALKKPVLQDLLFARAKPKGEPFVWFTGMGLALGICMIAFLLGLIVVKGAEVFWPRKIMLVSIDESAGKIKGSSVVAAELRMERIKHSSDTGTREKPLEWQLFLGNKEVYGLAFVFVDRKAVKKVELPRDIMRLERMEYGDAIGFPQELKLKDGTVTGAGSASFDRTLAKLVDEAGKRWKAINKMEREQIGSVNYKMRRLELEKKALGKKAGPAALRKINDIEDGLKDLQKQYETLAANSRALRAMQKEHTLSYKLATGEEKQISTGDIVHFYYPNRLNLFQRLGLFTQNIWHFLSEEPREANTEGGVFPAIFGTFAMTVLMSAAVLPFGVLAAIYLREYAKQGFFVRAVRIAVNNLAGVPSIVFGVFGLGFFVYFVGGTIDRLFFSDALPTPTFGTGGILWASLTLALLTVPVVIVATEEALAAVPRGMREGSMACGASKWQTIRNIVLPAAAPGILTGLILAMARGASEVAPLMLVGVVKLAPNLPIDGVFPYVHLERKFMHLGFHIYDLGFQSPDSEAAKPMVFATTLLLIGLVVVLNIGAILIREKLRRKYSTGAF